MNSISVVNLFLNNRRVSQADFVELCYVVDLVGTNDQEAVSVENILSFFRFIQENEISGWRTKKMTSKIVALLINCKKQPIQFYSLFCPSYKKGPNESGFRIDGVGETTKSGVKNLRDIYEKCVSYNFKCEKPLAIFFDLAVEQPEKVLPNKMIDLKKNIDNFKKILPAEIDFLLLSKIEYLCKKVGYRGAEMLEMPVSTDIYDSIIERGYKFYQHFNWSMEKVVSRSKVIISSEAIVGGWLRENIPSGVMVYTPTMLERSKIYSGLKYKTDPLPILFPIKMGR